jgi:hypothetical protein
LDVRLSFLRPTVLDARRVASEELLAETDVTTAFETLATDYADDFAVSYYLSCPTTRRKSRLAGRASDFSSRAEVPSFFQCRHRGGIEQHSSDGAVVTVLHVLDTAAGPLGRGLFGAVATLLPKDEIPTRAQLWAERLLLVVLTVGYVTLAATCVSPLLDMAARVTNPVARKLAEGIVLAALVAGYAAITGKRPVEQAGRATFNFLSRPFAWIRSRKKRE